MFPHPTSRKIARLQAFSRKLLLMRLTPAWELLFWCFGVLRGTGSFFARNREISGAVSTKSREVSGTSRGRALVCIQCIVIMRMQPLSGASRFGRLRPGLPGPGGARAPQDATLPRVVKPPELSRCPTPRQLTLRSRDLRIGEPWLDHDERYRRSEEFIRCLRGIWTEDKFTFLGDFYRFHDFSLKPKPIDPLPEIFQGGSSRAARDMASRVSDVYFTNGNTPGEIAKQVNDIRQKAAQTGHQVKVGVNAFVVARHTEPEARAVVQEIIDKALPEAVNAFGAEVKNAWLASPEREGNWAKSTFDDLVQYNDGFRSNLIGTPQQIAERILSLKDAGADLILLGFLHFQEEVAAFGEHVIPLVRELEARRESSRVAAE